VGVVRAGIATLAATVAATAGVDSSAPAAPAAGPLPLHRAPSNVLAAPDPHPNGVRRARRVEELAALLGLRRIRQM
jgi:hypothetical protein